MLCFVNIVAAQETLFSAGGNNIYTNIFDDGSLHSFTSGGTAAAIGFSTSGTGNLNQVTSGNCLQSGTVTTAGSISYSILGTGTDLNANDYEWSILYKTTIANTSNLVDLINGAPASNQAGWRFWLNSQDAAPTASTQGFYVTQIGNKIVLRINYGTYNSDIISYTLPTPTTTNPVYNIKVQRRILSNTVYWYMAVGESTSTTPETTISAGFSDASVTAYNTYGYTALESYSKTGSPATFKWDEIKLYTRTLNVTGLDRKSVV